MIELRHIVYLAEPAEIKDLIKQNVKAFVDERGNLYRILSENKVEKINFKNNFTFTDFLTGETYTVKAKEGKCHKNKESCSKKEDKSECSTQCSTQCNKQECPTQCKPGKEPLFKVSTFLYTLDNRISGPITLRKCDDLNLWSTGAIVMTATQGSVDVQFELKNQIIANRDPIPGVDFAGYQSNGIFYNEIGKRLYLYNADGTFTLVDLSSAAASIFINESTFVDPTYGSLTGVNDDLGRAFATLVQGDTAAALSPRTIYVQPGTYTITSPLILRSNIRWFFTEGAVVNSTASSVFTDNGANVTTTITGYGIFNVTGAGGPVLNLIGVSDILFEGQSISVNSTAIPAVFEFGNTNNTTQNVIINVDDISNLSLPVGLVSASIIHINNSFSTVVLNSSTITSTNVIYVENNSFGAIDFNTSSINGGISSISGDNLPAGSLFRNESNTFVINVSAQDITTSSRTQAIYATNTSGNSSPAMINIAAKTLFSDGGIVWAAGADNTQLIFLQLTVRLTINEIRINNIVNDIIPFYVNNAVLIAGIQLYLNPRADTIFNVNLLNGARVKLDTSIFLTETSRAFNVTNVTPTVLNITNLIAEIANISCAEQLLFTENQVGVDIESVKITCLTSIPDTSAIQTTGVVPSTPSIDNASVSITIDTNVLLLNGTGTDAVNLLNIIDHLAGILNLKAILFGLAGVNYNAIHIGPGLIINTLTIESTGIIDNNSRFLFCEGSTSIDIGILAVGFGNPLSTAGALLISSLPNTGGVAGFIRTIYMQGNGIAINIINDGVFTGTIDSLIFLQGGGNAIELDNNGNFSGTLNLVTVDSGSIVRTRGIGNTNLTANFGSLISLNSQVSFDLQSQGYVQLNGANVTLNNSPGATHFIVSNTQEFYLNSPLITTGECDYILFADFNSIVDIHFGKFLSSGNFDVYGFNTLDSSNVSLVGTELNLSSSGLTAEAFISQDAAQLSIRSDVLTINQVDIIAHSLLTSTLNLQYRQLNTGGPGCNIAFRTDDDSTMHVFGFLTNISGPASTSAMISAFNDSEFVGNFASFFINSPTDIGIAEFDNARITATFQTLSTQGVNLVVHGTGSVWVKADRWTTNNARNVSIESPLNTGNVVTVGGYMTTNGADYNIFYDLGAATISLRLLSSILVSSTNSIFSGLAVPNVSLAPSSAQQAAIGVNLFPAAAFFVDPGVF